MQWQNNRFVSLCCYSFEKITDDISKPKHIISPIEMDMIEFKKWNGTKLEFTCDEFVNWDRHLTMQYNSETDEISILNG